jgi:hypothetical protein
MDRILQGKLLDKVSNNRAGLIVDQVQVVIRKGLDGQALKKALEYALAIK